MDRPTEWLVVELPDTNTSDFQDLDSPEGQKLGAFLDAIDSFDEWYPPEVGWAIPREARQLWVVTSWSFAKHLEEYKASPKYPQHLAILQSLAAKNLPIKVTQFRGFSNGFISKFTPWTCLFDAYLPLTLSDDTLRRLSDMRAFRPFVIHLSDTHGQRALCTDGVYKHENVSIVRFANFWKDGEREERFKLLNGGPTKAWKLLLAQLEELGMKGYDEWHVNFQQRPPELEDDE
ncbi:hypothetical protein BT63DRAFT_417390 [Microthyrium microscopicum]|uniref:ABM domain-containing protein n=1 Tax=Microthyrium microscopicum TaxID=703497 RepID=A0A6A6U137_9PEZI|nr:hypothetical protein BT63DRAFT_417390 [Microthyrium microscopicum]